MRKLSVAAAAVVIILISGPRVFAEPVAFPSVWEKISAASPAQEAAALQTRAAMSAKDRADLYWMPRVYADARGYGTNDPGTAFFGLLEQRALRQNDFNPDDINHPGSNIFTRGALGVDLPLYTGGMNTAQIKVQKHALAAAENESSQIRLEEYSRAGASFASIAILSKQKKKLEGLKRVTEQLMKDYQLGQKSNPVGYSGLLGMKSLSNRVSGLLSGYNAQILSHYHALREMGVKDEDWSPQFSDAVHFAETYFTAGEGSSGSYRQASLRESAAAGAAAGSMERAKSLPRLGAFAESYVFNGERDTAAGYTAGLYLNWSLFDPSNRGTFKEAGLKAGAAEKSSEAFARQEAARRDALRETLNALRENIAVLNDTDKISLEQAKVVRSLFQNGAVGALQFIEVLNRRVDLISQQSDAELAFIKSSAETVIHEKFDIQKALRNNQ